MEILLILAGLVFGPDNPGNAQYRNDYEQERTPGVVFEVIVDPTWYNPSLGGINGMGDYSRTAGGYLVDEWYGNGIACPPEFPYGTVFQFWNHNWTCIDRGGSIIMRGDVVRVDVLHRTGVQRELTPALVFLPAVEVEPIILPDPPTPIYPNKPDFICPIYSCTEVIQTIHDDHYGVDLATPTFSVLRSPAPGIVEFAGQDKGCGGSIVINHGDGWSTRMCHLVYVGVEVGQQVTAGQGIGVVGASGLSAGEHLHIEIYLNGLERDFTRLIEPVLETGAI